MDSHLLQDWLSVTTTSSISVAQSSTSWLDLADYEDITIYLQVSAITVGQSVRSDTILSAYAAVPPARYLRWRLSLSGTLSFRIFVAAYSLTR
jgi:hypothetical protein